MTTPAPSILYSHMPPQIPEPDAVAYGQDQYGYWQEFAVKGVLQRFRWIHPGTFMMGSPETEAERYEDEIQHEVELTQGFWLADTACSQALWMAVMGENENPSRFKGKDKPVENVSWDDVQDFIQKLDFKASLPSEAQWEYACRAGTTTKFSFGDDLDPSQANFNTGEYTGEYKGTVPVQNYEPNPWGLFHMHGNVWEWCEDRYGEYKAGSQQDPKGPQSGRQRVLRGGSWFSDARFCRSANPLRLLPGLRYDNTGFRLARGLQLE